MRDMTINEKISSIKKHYLKTNETLELIEYGAGKQGHYTMSAGQYMQRTAISDKYGRLLHQLVRYYSVNHVIETGTALGISSAWMALANPNVFINTIEANAALCNMSESTFSKFNINNIKVHHGLVADVLPEIIKTLKPQTLIFIDAHHTAEATLRYFNMMKPYLLQDVIMVFDDINYSPEMFNAWKKIVGDEQVTLSINLYRMGVIFFNPALSKQEFYLYY